MHIVILASRQHPSIPLFFGRYPYFLPGGRWLGANKGQGRIPITIASDVASFGNLSICIFILIRRLNAIGNSPVHGECPTPFHNCFMAVIRCSRRRTTLIRSENYALLLCSSVQLRSLRVEVPSTNAFTDGSACVIT